MLFRSAKLNEEEIKELVIYKKWYGTLFERLEQLMQQINQQLTASVISLVERYENTLPQLDAKVEDLEKRVTAHLEAMGF